MSSDHTLLAYFWIIIAYAGISLSILQMFTTSWFERSLKHTFIRLLFQVTFSFKTKRYKLLKGLCQRENPFSDRGDGNQLLTEGLTSYTTGKKLILFRYISIGYTFSISIQYQVKIKKECELIFVSCFSLWIIEGVLRGEATYDVHGPQ